MKRILNKFIFELSNLKSNLILKSNNHDYNNWLNYFKIKNKSLKDDKYNFNFFNYHYTNSDALGPLQKDEAIFLYSIIKCVCPRIVVEFGFHKGHSAFAIANALDQNSLFITCDISHESEKIFKKHFKNYKFIKFILEDMSKINFRSIITEKKIDLVFFDAVHDFEINKTAFININEFLLDDSLIIIHDTGLWKKEMMNLNQEKALRTINHKYLGPDLIAHQIDERKFSNYLVSEHNFNPLHIHTLNKIRHGLTILQKGKGLLDV